MPQAQHQTSEESPRESATRMAFGDGEGTTFTISIQKGHLAWARKQAAKEGVSLSAFLCRPTRAKWKREISARKPVEPNP